MDEEQTQESILHEHLSQLPSPKKGIVGENQDGLKHVLPVPNANKVLFRSLSFGAQDTSVVLDTSSTVTFKNSPPLHKINNIVEIEASKPKSQLGPSVRNFLKPSQLSHSATPSLIRPPSNQPRAPQNSDGNNHISNNTCNNSTTLNHVIDKVSPTDNNGDSRSNASCPVIVSHFNKSRRLSAHLLEDANNTGLKVQIKRVIEKSISDELPAPVNIKITKSNRGKGNFIIDSPKGKRLTSNKNGETGNGTANVNNGINPEVIAELVESRVQKVEKNARIPTNGNTSSMNHIPPVIDLKKANVNSDISSKAELTSNSDGSGKSNERSLRNSSKSTTFETLLPQPEQINNEEEIGRRTRRKRRPTTAFMQDMIVPSLKIKKRKDSVDNEVLQATPADSSTESTQPKISEIAGIITNSTVNVQKLQEKPKVPGRGRGRPKGSTKKKSNMNKIKNSIIPEVLPVQPEIPIATIPKLNTEVAPVQGRRRGAPRGPRASRRNRSKKSTPRKKNALKPKQISPLVTSNVEIFEEETRMSGDLKSESEVATIDVKTSKDATFPIDDESRASSISTTSTSTSKTKKFSKELIEERKPVTAETLYEYQWPLDDNNAEYYMLQEQLVEYLGIKSFRRKYPDLKRRTVDMEERDFLRSQQVVSETQVDLGLTAINSHDILDVMFHDFPEKYSEYQKVVDERKERELKEMRKCQTQPSTSGSSTKDKSVDYLQRLLKSCSKWNESLNKERRVERNTALDSQTNTVLYPKNRYKVLAHEATQVGHYPVPVLPGQYCDHYKKYTPTELNYLPLNTVRYGPVVEPPKHLLDSDSDSDSESSSSEDSSGSSSDEEISKSVPIEKENTGEVVLSETQNDTPGSFCKSCESDEKRNKKGEPENLVQCAKCCVYYHPTCIDLSAEIYPLLKRYDWQCTDCKNCIECDDPADEDKMLFCDLCDRGYHIYCVGLRKVPTGRWHCKICAVCYSCQATKASAKDMNAEWFYVLETDNYQRQVYLCSLCSSCSKIFAKGLWCPICMKCLNNEKIIPNATHVCCTRCHAWTHMSCCKSPPSAGYICVLCKNKPQNDDTNHSSYPTAGD